jgi:magnesium transporter
MPKISKRLFSGSNHQVSKKVGMPPGSLIHIGEDHSRETEISQISYSALGVETRILDSVAALRHYQTGEAITWLNIAGLADIKAIEAIGQHFDIHRLVLEDILNTHQRPKCEHHDNFIYLVLKSLVVPESGADSAAIQGLKSGIQYQQISILLLDRLVITFEESSSSALDHIKQRLNNSSGRFRSQGSDYLAYEILDSIIDQYFEYEEYMAEQIDDVEEELLINPTNDTLIRIQRLKRELIKIRRIISPLRELLNGLLRSDSPLIHAGTHIYLRDVFDHCLRIAEMLDSYRDMTTGLLDIYISSISNRMNEIMKVLTIFASIFIPLTFITGIYGMNFDDMPELHWPWAYPALWGLFISIAGGLLVYFKRRHWL